MTDDKPIVVNQVSAEAVYPLRHRVLRPHQPFAACVWAQDTDPDTAHFGAVMAGQIVAVASIAICPRDGDPPNAWRLRGMATAPELQSRGIGATVLRACLDYVKSKSGALLWCNARTTALQFYRRHGFETVGDEFDIKGIGPHYVMVHTLTPSNAPGAAQQSGGQHQDRPQQDED